jgi:hypothetical protein
MQGESFTITGKFRQRGVGEFTILYYMVKVQTHVQIIKKCKIFYHLFANRVVKKIN